MSGKLPRSTTAMPDWTDDELAAMIAFHEQEMRAEWCVTLIWQELDVLRREQDRRALLAALDGPPSLVGIRVTTGPAAPAKSPRMRS